MYPEKTTILKDTCTSVFIIAIFTITRTCKQSKCPVTEKWTKMFWYIYTMEYYSDPERNKYEPVVVRQVNLEPLIQSEVNQCYRNLINVVSEVGFRDKKTEQASGLASNVRGHCPHYLPENAPIVTSEPRTIQIRVGGSWNL